MSELKNAYLAKLTEQLQMKSVKVGKNLEGTTPPSVFIGRWSYPKVYAGPMMSSQMGDTHIMDAPEDAQSSTSFSSAMPSQRMTSALAAPSA